MDHTAAQALFSELEDGELAAPARAELDAHLVDCAACRGELEAFRRTLSSIRGAGLAMRRGGLDVPGAGAPSPAFMDTLKAQINTRSRGRFFGQRRRGYRLELVSLITLLVAMTVYVVLTLAQPMWLVR